MSIKDVICDVILDAINSDNIRQLCSTPPLRIRTLSPLRETSPSTTESVANSPVALAAKTVKP